jgi:hypothetical protein
VSRGYAITREGSQSDRLGSSSLSFLFCLLLGQLFIIKSYFQSWEFKREEPVAAGHHHLLGTEFCDPAPLNTSTPAFPFRDGFSLFFFSCTDIGGYAFVELTFSQDGKKILSSADG